MKNRFATQDLLMMYELVTRFGQRQGDNYHWQGVTASLGHDGYEVYLAADGVSLRLGFHNTYLMDYQTASQLGAFQSRLKGLLSHYRERLSPAISG